LAPVDEANLPERAEDLCVFTPATTRGAIADQGLNLAASPRFLKMILRKRELEPLNQSSKENQIEIRS
jgi:hypothetical protein